MSGELMTPYPLETAGGGWIRTAAPQSTAARTAATPLAKLKYFTIPYSFPLVPERGLLTQPGEGRKARSETPLIVKLDGVTDESGRLGYKDRADAKLSCFGERFASNQRGGPLPQPLLALPPLDYTLSIAEAETPTGLDASVAIARETLRFEAAKAATPYWHPRLAAVTLGGDTEKSPSSAAKSLWRVTHQR